MSYLSLARKYRPQTFDEIIGQEHIATTLKNAISMDMVAHAYLFTGPRGVGKTSTARILAKSLDCEKAPTSKPCGKCVSCKEITAGISMDVLEIDGASNRGIDEIRNLKENIKFAPANGGYRIYIIDEVHMLTPEAFNALLKTLEEPPAHVKFIFATTRPYKVLPTIVSRCQRFDFRKIPFQDIIKKIRDIKEKEKLKIKDDAIFLIAKASDGSLRDAEVILDQLLSFTKGNIEPEDVSKALGLLEQDVLFDLAEYVVSGQRGKILSAVNTLVDSGKDPAFIASSIAEHFRNLMVAKVAKDENACYLTLSEEDNRRLQEQSLKFSLDDILYIIYTLSATIDLIKKTSLGRIPLEISLIKLTEKKRLTSIQEVLERLSALEKRLLSGIRQDAIEGNASSKKEPYSEPESYDAHSSNNKPFSAGESTGSDSTSDITFSPNENKSQKAPVATEVFPGGTGRPAAETQKTKTPEIAAEKDILLLQKIKSSWPKVLNFIKNKKISMATFLSEGVLVQVKDNELSIGFAKNNSLHKEAVESDANKTFIREAINSITGESVALNIETIDKKYIPANGEEMPESDESIMDALGTNKIDPIVEDAIDIFGGRIIDITNTNRKNR